MERIKKIKINYVPLKCSVKTATDLSRAIMVSSGTRSLWILVNTILNTVYLLFKRNAEETEDLDLFGLGNSTA